MPVKVIPHNYLKLYYLLWFTLLNPGDPEVKIEDCKIEIADADIGCRLVTTAGNTLVHICLFKTKRIWQEVELAYTMSSRLAGMPIKLTSGCSLDIRAQIANSIT